MDDERNGLLKKPETGLSQRNATIKFSKTLNQRDSVT